MEKHNFYLLLIMTASFHLCMAQDQWDLKQCAAYALDHNTSVQQQEIQARYDQLIYQQSKLSQYPSVNFSNSTGLTSGRSIDRTTNQFTTQSIFYSTFSLQGSVEVFNFYSKRNTIAADRYMAEASEASIERLKNDLSLNVVGAYLQALLNKQQVKVNIVQIQQRIAQLSNTRKLIKAGLLPELNAVQLEAQLAQDSASFITAKEAEIKSLLYMKALLNLDAAMPFDIQTPPVDSIKLEPLSYLQPEALYQLALNNFPQQQVNRLRLKAAHKNVEAAKATMYPSISLYGNLQTGYSNARNKAEANGYKLNGYTRIGIVERTKDSVIVPVRSTQYRFYADPFGTQLANNFGNNFGLSMTIPIFNGGSARTSFQRAKLKIKAVELQQQQDDMILKQEIYKAFSDAITSLQKFNAEKKSQEAAKKAFDAAMKRYELGLLSTFDVITAQNHWYNAKSQELLAQYEYVFKMKVLEFYKGEGLKM
ncbi:TolC family protein [Chitinophagaceae bacterium LB-8]|uniref:TolC family protein n=1 Tax=Paraflavisolibacter caeni TaxID=2982496 RepID=A0A9X2XP55_9BACT|nr:TolC family protein [Paraflavisolibacter caeni]MCU7549959.1 TolC family protein [Paraflavisolibacter caeni]